jgi:uncharacterized protein (DUF983 family)
MPDTALTIDRSSLPGSLGAALWRGICGKCPRCNGTHLFKSFLKPVERCRLCGQNWTLHAADDFPPYVSILLTGHLIAPVIIGLGMVEVSLWAMTALVALLAVSLLIGLLQPAKGGIIALQWWLGLHGFAPAPGKREAGL